MSNENSLINKNEKEPCENELIELPEDVQRRMMEFFLQTSIPRKKAMSMNNSLPDNERQEN